MINENALMLDKSFEDTINMFTRKIKTKTENNINKWFNNELRGLKRIKINKYKKATIVNSDEALSTYRSIRNFYKVRIENGKNKYITNRISNAKDQKKEPNCDKKCDI